MHLPQAPYERPDPAPVLDVSEDIDAQCPRWDQFVAELIPDDAERTKLQRAVGYTLTGYTTEHQAFLLAGDCIGKTLFLGVLTSLLGTTPFTLWPYQDRPPAPAYAVTGPASDLGDSTKRRFLMARAREARLLVLDAGEDIRSLVRLRGLVGGEPVEARFKYGEPFKYMPTFKVWTSLREVPKGVDVGTDGRLCVFRCDNIDLEPDTKLLAALRDELPGILNWALTGASLWYREGLHRKKGPPKPQPIVELLAPVAPVLSPREPGRPVFEYKADRYVHTTDESDLGDYLNEMGAQGWELVAVTTEVIVTYYWKRQNGFRVVGSGWNAEKGERR